MGLQRWTLFNRSLVTHTFIETGTQHGVTLDMAVLQPFQRIVTIDIVQAYIQEAIRKYGRDDRLAFYTAHSPSVLRTVIQPQYPTTFWLDAHYCGGPKEEMLSDCECPLTEELRTIMRFAWNYAPIILIDDAMNFVHPWPVGMNPGCNEMKWPSLREIATLLPDHAIVLMDNVFYCLPRGW